MTFQTHIYICSYVFKWNRYTHIPMDQTLLRAGFHLGNKMHPPEIILDQDGLFTIDILVKILTISKEENKGNIDIYRLDQTQD